VHSRAGKGPRSPDPEADWTRLEILDQHTLATVGALNIDWLAWQTASTPSDGRLLLDVGGVLYLVDIRNPQAPRMQAAVPCYSGAFVFGHGELVVADASGLLAYPIDVENLSF
jgi:hypothetical protein